MCEEAEKFVDFAISYAGEDAEIADEITRRLEEFGYSVFFAQQQQELLVGIDGESFFEQLFKTAKEVLVLVSKHYKRKKWPQFEWDIIQERDYLHRFIPIRLDDTKILGLPSKIIYLPFENGYESIVKTCITKILLFEKNHGIHRPSEFQEIAQALKMESEGALAKAYQLVVDKRKRKTPLENLKLSFENFQPHYKLLKGEWCDFSVIRRRVVRISIPKGLSYELLRKNLVHCAENQFNRFKPDALMVFAYKEESKDFDFEGLFTAGRVILAPFGKWEKADEGVVYNLPVSEFKINISLSPDYFEKD